MEKRETTEETYKRPDHWRVSQWLLPFILIIAIIILLYLIRTNR